MMGPFMSLKIGNIPFFTDHCARYFFFAEK